MRGSVAMALGLLALGAAATCGRAESPATAEVALAQEFQLAPGQSARLPDGATVTFEGVTGDSRCPTDVQCVWEGDAVVRLSLRPPGSPVASLELHTAGRFEHEAALGRYRVRLVGLAPQPREGHTIPPEQYRATLLVVTASGRSIPPP